MRYIDGYFEVHRDECGVACFQGETSEEAYAQADGYNWETSPNGCVSYCPYCQAVQRERKRG